MKKVLLTVSLLFFLKSINCQTQNIGNWLLSLNEGIEAHDKRNYIQNRLITSTPEKFGTYHFGGLLQRKLMEISRVSIFGGIGFNYEKATMRRSFEHGLFFDGPVPDILLYQNRYTKLSAPASVTCWFEVSNNFYFSALIESNWLVHRHITHTTSSWRGFPYYQTTFELEDIQCRLGLRYKLHQVVIGFDIRAFNFQTVDRLLFSPGIEESWEWNNPLRLDYTIGYTW